MMETVELWELFQAVTKDPAAWPALMTALEPELVAIARQQPIGRLRDREDSPREITAAVFARFHSNDHAVIRRLCAQQPRPELRAWLRVVVRRAAIDYMRANPEFERASNRWISLATLTSSAPEIRADADSLVEKRAQVLSSLREMVAAAATETAARGEDAIGHLALEWGVERLHVRRLVARGEQYLTVIGAVFAGHSHTDTAAQLGLTRREVELTLGYVEDLLRARFATE
jgi:DNA-directed RNA polymerase specialized sigma24 family protein